MTFESIISLSSFALVDILCYQRGELFKTTRSQTSQRLSNNYE